MRPPRRNVVVHRPTSSPSGPPDTIKGYSIHPARPVLDELLGQALKPRAWLSIAHDAHIQVDAYHSLQSAPHSFVDPLRLISEGSAAKLRQKQDLRGKAMRVDDSSPERGLVTRYGRGVTATLKTWWAAFFVRVRRSDFMSLASYRLRGGDPPNSAPQARTMTPGFIVAKATDRNRCPTGKSCKQLDGLSRLRAFQFALISAEKCPTHGGIIEVPLARSPKELCAGGNDRKPNIEVPVAPPSSAWDAARRTTGGADSQALATPARVFNLERLQFDGTLHGLPPARPFHYVSGIC